MRQMWKRLIGYMLFSTLLQTRVRGSVVVHVVYMLVTSPYRFDSQSGYFFMH